MEGNRPRTRLLLNGQGVFKPSLPEMHDVLWQAGLKARLQCFLWTQEKQGRKDVIAVLGRAYRDLGRPGLAAHELRSGNWAGRGAQKPGSKGHVDAQVVPVAALHHLLICQVVSWLVTTADVPWLRPMSMDDDEGRAGIIGDAEVRHVFQPFLHDCIGLVESDVGVHHHEKVPWAVHQRPVPACICGERGRLFVYQVQERVLLLESPQHRACQTRQHLPLHATFHVLHGRHQDDAHEVLPVSPPFAT